MLCNSANQMASIGKSPRLVSRVKSEFTVIGRRSGTPKSATPGSSQIPVLMTPHTPQTTFERKKFLTRRKLIIGDAKSHLTCSNRSSEVRDIVYHDASDKANVYACNPELQGTEPLNPNCIFVNVCSEHVKVSFRWREHLKRLWMLVGKVAQLLVACMIVVMSFVGALNSVYWLFGGKQIKRNSEETQTEDESLFYEGEDDNDNEDKPNQDLMVLNANGFSLTETTHAFSLIHVLIMTMARFFDWIGGVLLPGEG